MVVTILLILSITAFADLQVIAHYRLTDKDALGQVQGPQQLKNLAGNQYHLARKGAPRYMNIPPNEQDGRALQFDGKSAAYQLNGGIKSPASHFVLEAWVRAGQSNQTGLHGVVSLGDGARGYNLVQQGTQWGAFVGGRGFTPMGNVVPGQWTHLAMVYSSRKQQLYLDGKQVDTFPASTGINANFSIGDMGGGREFFAGDISEVRLSGIGEKGFEVTKDFLIDYKKLEKIYRESVAKRKARFKAALQGVPVTDVISIPQHDGDWLVDRCAEKSTFQVKVAEDGMSAMCVLANGLATRKFFLSENMVCYSLRHEPAGIEFLRSIKPEATITIDGRKILVGGMRFPSMASGHKGRGRSKYVANYYLEEWLEDMVADPQAFQLTRIRLGKPQAWLQWKPMTKADDAPWPPKGLRVSMDYMAPESMPELKGLKVTVQYEIYDGIPLIGKSLVFEQNGDNAVTLERTLIEELAFADENADKVYVESEYNHFHATPVRWYVDSEFRTDSGPIYTERMSDYRLRYWSQKELEDASVYFGGHPEWQGEYRSRSLMQVQYPEGPAKTLTAGQSWSTFNSWLLLQDSMDEDRKGLGRRKLYRTLMPWTQENLVYMHILSDKSEAIRAAVDQCAAVGFDMIVLTFGSGFNMMSTDPKYIARIKSDFDYAHSKGIKTGAYILFCSSRSYGNGEHDASPPAYGRSLCLGSEFGDKYFDQVIGFMEKTGMDCIETDGPYHGYRCEKTNHPLHTGRDDSWRVNWEQQCKFYEKCMDKGIYIITPDWYYASGGRKSPMGYKEANWTLPRKQQALIARQNIYDGTWWRTPSMCYHALPLTPVYGGGPESTMEPLSEHLEAYDSVLGQYFGMGIMACYRGYRLYDTEQTKQVVEKWVDFYRDNYSILNSDIIHVRRPDGRDLDCMMHVNPELDTRGLAFIWNPTDKPIRREFKLPLYYTGLKMKARINVMDRESSLVTLDRQFNAAITVDIPAYGYTWMKIEAPHQSNSVHQPAQFIEKLQRGQDVKIATMGTSLTGGRWRWVDVFEEWISNEFPGQVTIINRGVGASASSKFLPGKSGLDVLPTVVKDNPDVVFIEFAVNDAYNPYGISLTESKSNLNKMIDAILEVNPDAEIILQTMSPVADLEGANQKWTQTRPRIAAYYQGYRDVAAERGLLLIDHYPNWKKIRNENLQQFLEYVPDGVHPNLEAYRKIMLPEIEKVLLRKNDQLNRIN